MCCLLDKAACLGVLCAAVRIGCWLCCKNLVPVCREVGFGSVCYSPIRHGMLLGKYTKPKNIDPNDFRAERPRVPEEALAKVFLNLQCRRHC